MRFKIRVPEPGVRSSIALIVLAIGLVGFIQYSWFRQSASVEIEGAYRSLYSTVLQTMSREFQRYAPLLADLRAVNKGSLGSALEREYFLYGPAGSVPHLLSLVGIARFSDPSSAEVLGKGGSWQRKPTPIALPMPESIEAQLEGGVLIVCAGQGEAGKDRQFILIPAGSQSFGILELDSEGFFETYTKPAVASVLPDFRIDWTKDVHEGVRQGASPWSPRRQAARRVFNPVRALVGAPSRAMRTFTIVVPAAMDAFLMKGSLWFDSWSPGPAGGASYRPLQVGQGPDPHAATTMREARILVSSNSVVGSVERRLSLNWLFSSLLLMGLGYAFAQAVIQKHRLSRLSAREREFVASVTHELRTPVTAIRSAADNMRRGLVGIERMAPYGEMIHAQSLRLGSMIEEVLAFSQVEGRNVQSPVMAPIRSENLEAELRPPLDAIARAEGIHVDWDFGSMPQDFLGDLDTIRLVLSNLVANALYHAYPGPHKGVVRVLGTTLLPATIKFTVEDDGRGIAKKEAALVFEAFYRDEISRERHEKGSGLGLFIARRKARLLGGELLLENHYERADGSRRSGCRFTLTFPSKESGDVR